MFVKFSNVTSSVSPASMLGIRLLLRISSSCRMRIVTCTSVSWKSPEFSTATTIEKSSVTAIVFSSSGESSFPSGRTVTETMPLPWRPVAVPSSPVPWVMRSTRAVSELASSMSGGLRNTDSGTATPGDTFLA